MPDYHYQGDLGCSDSMLIDVALSGPPLGFGPSHIYTLFMFLEHGESVDFTIDIEILHDDFGGTVWTAWMAREILGGGPYYDWGTGDSQTIGPGTLTNHGPPRWIYGDVASSLNPFRLTYHTSPCTLMTPVPVHDPYLITPSPLDERC